ncbi:MAG: hypothetical protein AAF799_15415 [Myxococcota bacterium]
MSDDAGSQGVCIADPVPHRVLVDECETDADCPLGTICGLLPGADATASEVCTPPRGAHAPSDALTEGFGVPQMSGGLASVALPVADGDVVDVELSWRAPSDARVVTCVLLACPPVIEDGTIINYDQCVLARATSTQTQGAFSFDDAGSVYDAGSVDDCDGAAPTVDTRGQYAVTELLAGCWAYGSANLIAATRLLRPTPDQVSDFHDNFDLDCRGNGADGRTCLLEDGTMGSCSAEQCLRRCLRDEDCAPDGTQAREGACDRSIVFGMLSVCEDLGPVRTDEDEAAGSDARPWAGEGP